MKRSMKRVLAMIFTIIMVLGLVPFKSEEVEAGKKASFKSSILYIEEFKNENASLTTDINNYTKASLGKSVKSTVSTYRVSNSPNEKFIDVWNRMPDDQFIVVINTHGYPDKLLPDGPKTMQQAIYWMLNPPNPLFDVKDINKLKYKKISYIVLLGCNTGHASMATKNLARAFSDRFNTTVIAPDGTDSFWSEGGTYHYKPINDALGEFASYSGGRSTVYGWLAYTPANSSNGYTKAVYQIANGWMYMYTVDKNMAFELKGRYNDSEGTLFEILASYSRHYSKKIR
ncbi:MAG: hypothetical protein IKX10_03890 [Lachnospiraceae bacterium]|nr:hypothetical protein [Lachnospiraceae bacterium]